jgi:hypothetical protein
MVRYYEVKETFMPEIKISLLEESDAQELYAFELENSFF